MVQKSDFQNFSIHCFLDYPVANSIMNILNEIGDHIYWMQNISLSEVCLCKSLLITFNIHYCCLLHWKNTRILAKHMAAPTKDYNSSASSFLATTCSQGRKLWELWAEVSCTIGEKCPCIEGTYSSWSSSVLEDGMCVLWVQLESLSSITHGALCTARQLEGR